MSDVLICGGGPVGMGLAIELGQRGIDVKVLERHDTPQSIPKGQNLTQRTMEHMHAWGVENKIRDAKTIPKGIGMGGLTAFGSLTSGWHYDWFKRASVQQYYARENERLPQYATENVLRSRAAELPGVTICTGTTVQSIAQDGAGTSAVTDDGTLHRAKFLVGCDGARSVVRQGAGIQETLRDHDKPMALIVFRSPEFSTILEQFPDKQFYNVISPELDGYWMFFGMVDWEQKSFFFHAPVPPGTDRNNFDFTALLHSAIGQRIDLDIDYVGFWDLRIAYADTYRSDRIFIAGDAAHSHPPYGGYGINTGFEDSRNLGWKLASVLKGADPQLLESYDTERRPVFASTARDFIETFIDNDRAFVRRFDPETNEAEFRNAWATRARGGDGDGIASFIPNYDGSPIVCASETAMPSAIGAHEMTARAGYHLPPFTLHDDATVHDCLGAGFTLLSFGARVDDFTAAAKAISLDLKIHLFDHPQAREVYGSSLVLTRPDHYVAWVGDNCSNAEHVLRKVSGR